MDSRTLKPSKQTSSHVNIHPSERIKRANQAQSVQTKQNKTNQATKAKTLSSHSK